ncbi:chemotaxis protein CheX [bacterium]|nr:chemotaxis protein CheX [bacterium]
MEAKLKNLKTVISDVMEKMYFLLPDAEVDTINSYSSENHFLPIYIGIRGNPGYLLTFAFDRELAGSMAVDLLGVNETEVNDEIAEKCLKETANIIAGNFMLSFESQENLEITLPSARKQDIFGTDTITDEPSGQGNTEIIDGRKNSDGSVSLILSFNGYFLKAIIETVTNSV